MHRRLPFISAILFLVWTGLVFRLFYIQVVCSGQFRDLGKDQYLREVHTESHRGDILDRNGKVMAKDLAYYSFEAYPRYIGDRAKVASEFAREFKRSRNYYLSRLKKNSNFVYLERKVPAYQADKISEHNFSGVQRFTHFKRFYPYGNVTGQILGFTNIDNAGIEGLELRYDKYLAGKRGKMIVTSDAIGRKKTNFNYPVERPVSGCDIATTIDIDFQVIALEELTKAVNKYKARGGTVILMEPNTGEILAMTSVPTFDSNKYSTSREGDRRNRAITDIFEPGSIYKIVTATAALELGRIKPSDKFFCENGQIKIGRHTFRDAKPHGTMTFQEIIEYSSNIGTYKAAQIVGPQNIYKFSKKLGFGEKTGFDMHGEMAGMLKKPAQWSKTSLSSICIGQEVAVNALQILNAYAAVANGGMLMRPYVVKSIQDENGRVVLHNDPKEIRRAVSRNSAKILQSFFEGVVDHGTARLGTINGKTIAGKTGTAQKPDPVTKGYSDTDYIASFVAYYPADNPKIAGIVIVDTPRGSHYGGTVAGPAMRDILKRIVNLPKNTMLASSVSLNESGGKEESAWTKIKNMLPVFGSTEKVVAQEAPAGNGTVVGESRDTAAAVSEPVCLELTNENAGKKSGKSIIVKVPDVRGLSLREAVKILSSRGLDFEIKGSGIVKNQSPAPGKEVKQGTTTYMNADNGEKKLDRN